MQTVDEQRIIIHRYGLYTISVYNMEWLMKKDIQSLRISNLNEYREMHTVFFTNQLAQLQDAYALMVYVKISIGIIGKDEQTLDEMSALCDQSFVRFKKSLNILETMGYIATSHTHSPNRTHAILAITLLVPQLPTQISVKNPLLIPVTNTAQKRKKALYLSEWGDNPTKSVFTLWDSLQSVEPAAAVVYQQEAKYAAAIAQKYFPTYLQERWKILSMQLPKNRQGRLTLKWLLDRLPQTTKGNDNDTSPKTSDEEFFASRR